MSEMCGKPESKVDRSATFFAPISDVVPLQLQKEFFGGTIDEDKKPPCWCCGEIESRRAIESFIVPIAFLLHHLNITPPASTCIPDHMGLSCYVSSEDKSNAGLPPVPVNTLPTTSRCSPHLLSPRMTRGVFAGAGVGGVPVNGMTGSRHGVRMYFAVVRGAQNTLVWRAHIQQIQSAIPVLRRSQGLCKTIDLWKLSFGALKRGPTESCDWKTFGRPLVRSAKLQAVSVDSHA